MSKFTEETYGSTKEILKFPDHYVALAVMVDDSGVSAVDGKKIVPRGTVVGGSSGSAIAALDEPVVGKYVEALKASKIFETSASAPAIKVTAIEGGTDGNGITVAIVVSGTSTAFSLALSTKAITINMKTSGAGAAESEAADIVEAINAHATIGKLVFAEVAGEDSAIPDAAAATNLSGGAASSVTGAEGILMNDVDVTYGPKEGAMIIHGFIAIDKLPYGASNADAAAKAGAVVPMVQFIK